jgi:hypothetical protein
VETSDIFTTITRYDKPENRFTASVVYLIRYLWSNSKEEQRKALCRFLSDLCQCEFTPLDKISLDMQKLEKGDDDKKRILDFEVSSPKNVLVWVEVKDTAQHQIYKNDKVQLQEEARKRGCEGRLVLLSHYSVSEIDKKGVASHVT